MKDLKIMLCLWLGMPGWLFAQSVPNNSSLEISQIMQGERFVGYLPQNVYWSVDGKFIYFSWNPNQDTLRSLYKVDPNGGSPQKVSTEEQKSLPSRFGDRWEDQYVYAKNGDLFLMNLKTGQQQQITNTLARENNPQFTADGQAIVFNQSNNLFLWKISDGSLTQLSNFQSGNARRESSPRGYKKWLEDDQMAYFEILRKRNREAALRQAQNEALAVKRPRAIYLGDKRVSNLELSPDRRYITYRLSKSPRSERTKVPNYVTESGFVEELNARAKVGSPQPTYESWIFDLQRDSAYQIQVEQIEGIYDKPTFL
ncbi:MAG: DPP IV N-terminal domain-containing protein, partial [Bacteroidota bacterium]